MVQNPNNYEQPTRINKEGEAERLHNNPVTDSMRGQYSNPNASDAQEDKGDVRNTQAVEPTGTSGTQRMSV